MLRRRSAAARRGPIDLAFTVTSSEGGYRLEVRTEGLWTRRWRTRHHDPAAAAASHVIDQVTQLAKDTSVLAHAELQYRANRRLGLPVDLPCTGVRVRWASVRIHARPEDLLDAQAHERAAAAARSRREEQQHRLNQYADFRDLLREDPTLALAQLLLENPASVASGVSGLLNEIAGYVAASSPGAKWVQTARLLEGALGELKPDAKQFIVDRFCTALLEFGVKETADHLRAVHRVPGPEHSAALQPNTPSKTG